MWQVEFRWRTGGYMRMTRVTGGVQLVDKKGIGGRQGTVHGI